MISRWKWMLKQTIKKLWFRATLFAIVAIITALLSILFKSMIPESVSVKVGAEAVDNILNILASSMLAVTTFSLSIMVTAYGSATTNVTPRATRLVVEDVTTQNVLATFIGSFLLKWSTKTGHRVREGANKQVISSQADSLIKISRIWADFFPANTSNQPI